MAVAAGFRGGCGNGGKTGIQNGLGVFGGGVGVSGGVAGILNNVFFGKNIFFDPTFHTEGGVRNAFHPDPLGLERVTPGGKGSLFSQLYYLFGPPKII